MPPAPNSTRLDRAAETCAARGAQLTALRREVLRLVLEADGPVTAYQLLDRLRQVRAGAVPPTVYRALDFLLAQGLIHRIERLNAFVACPESDHQHAAQFLICRRCGTVVELDDTIVARALDAAARRQGFHPAHAVVEIEGLCAACASSVML
ncbi:MAG: transcriptional repressor [Acetobacteraceae bacterium]|nr:transcriptional repressor [Acetobacteraceae bacterium]